MQSPRLVGRYHLRFGFVVVVPVLTGGRRRDVLRLYNAPEWFNNKMEEDCSIILP